MNVCGFSEAARPKKWWPQFSYIACDHHRDTDLPDPVRGWVRGRYEGIGTRFVGLLDEPPT